MHMHARWSGFSARPELETTDFVHIETKTSLGLTGPRLQI